jgi:hypothetical protein
MDPRHDHGEGAGPRPKQGNDISPHASVQHDRATLSIHPVLKALVQLLARQAAAECLAASSGGSPNAEETSDDQDEETRKG